MQCPNYHPVTSGMRFCLQCGAALRTTSIGAAFSRLRQNVQGVVRANLFGWASAAVLAIALLVFWVFPALSARPPANTVPRPSPKVLASKPAAAVSPTVPTPTTIAPTPARTLTPPTPRATNTPTADQAWQQTLRELDAVWEKDWPRAIRILDDYRSRFPDYAPAKEKLYATLVAYGQQLLRQGQVNDGIPQLVRARTLLPDRGEAIFALAALTPTPTPSPTRVPPTWTPRPPDPPASRPESGPVAKSEMDCARVSSNVPADYMTGANALVPGEWYSFFVYFDNCGTSTWSPPRYKILVAGFRPGTQSQYDANYVGPGTSWNVNLSNNASMTPGRYRLTLRLMKDGNPFGPTFTIDQEVKAR